MILLQMTWLLPFHFQTESIISFTDIARRPQMRQYTSNAVQQTTTGGHWSIRVCNSSQTQSYKKIKKILRKENNVLFLTSLACHTKWWKKINESISVLQMHHTSKRIIDLYVTFQLMRLFNKTIYGSQKANERQCSTKQSSIQLSSNG